MWKRDKFRLGELIGEVDEVVSRVELFYVSLLVVLLDFKSYSFDD